MAQPNFINFASPELQAQQAALERQQALADMLRKDSMTPLESTSVSNPNGGSIAVKTNPWAGLAKLGQAYFAKQGQDDADQKRIALAQAMKQSNMGEVNDYMAAMKGTPAVPEQPGQSIASPDNPQGAIYTDEPGVPVADQQGYKTLSTPGQAAIAPDEAKAMAIALGSNNPTLNTLGAHQLTSNIDQAQTAKLLAGIQGSGQPQQAASPVAPPPISQSNDNPTQLSPVSQVAAPAGPLTPQQTQAIQADMAQRGDQQGQTTLSGTPAELTPMQKYEKSVGYTQQQAMQMEASGNKALMALGKQINDGYKQAQLETIIKQPFKAQQATQAQGARADEGAANRASREGMAANRLTASQLPPMTDAERASAGAQIASGQPITQVIPGWGPASRARQQEAKQEAIEQIKAANPGMDDKAAGAELAMRSIGFSADKGSVGQLTKMEGATIPVVKQLNYNIDRTTQILKEIGDRDISPIVNAVADGVKVWTGDPRFASLFFHMQGAAIEAARLRSGGQASVAQLHASAMDEARKWADSHMTPATWADISKSMKDEGEFKLQAYKDASNAMRNRAGTGSGSVPAAPAGVKEETWVRNAQGQLVRQ